MTTVGILILNKKKMKLWHVQEEMMRRPAAPKRPMMMSMHSEEEGGHAPGGAVSLSFVFCMEDT